FSWLSGSAVRTTSTSPGFTGRRWAPVISGRSAMPVLPGQEQGHRLDMPGVGQRVVLAGFLLGHARVTEADAFLLEVVRPHRDTLRQLHHGAPELAQHHMVIRAVPCPQLRI